MVDIYSLSSGCFRPLSIFLDTRLPCLGPLVFMADTTKREYRAGNPHAENVLAILAAAVLVLPAEIHQFRTQFFDRRETQKNADLSEFRVQATI